MTSSLMKNGLEGDWRQILTEDFIIVLLRKKKSQARTNLMAARMEGAASGENSTLGAPGRQLPLLKVKIEQVLFQDVLIEKTNFLPCSMPSSICLNSGLGSHLA